MSKVVAGVNCVVVSADESLDGVIQEGTLDWYAQDDDGNVWYMGEAVTNYEYDHQGNQTGTNSNGFWEASLDISGTGSNAQAGYLLPAPAVAGGTYYQEYYLGEAEDVARILQDSFAFTVDGTTYQNCIRSIDWNPLDRVGLEYKIYAPGVGLLVEQGSVGGEDVELVDTSL